jgi:hypothetical protein
VRRAGQATKEVVPCGGLALLLPSSTGARADISAQAGANEADGCPEGAEIDGDGKAGHRQTNRQTNRQTDRHTPNYRGSESWDLKNFDLTRLWAEKGVYGLGVAPDRDTD